MSDIQPPQEILKEVLSHYHQDNFLKAEALAKNLIKEHSNNIFLLKILGVIYAKQGKFNKALEYNKRVISVNVKDSEGYNNLGLCYKNLNRIVESIDAFKEAIRLNSSYADAYYNLSNVYEMQGNYNYSLEANLQAVTHKTKNIKAYLQLGVKMMARGRNEEALLHLESGRTLAPHDSELGICYSTCLIRLDRCHDAKNCLNKMLEHDPNNSDVYTNLGYALMSEGDFSEAILALEKAISLNENNAKSHFNLSQIKKYTMNDPHLQLMESLHKSCSLNDNDRCLLCFALGKAFGDVGDIQKEFLLLKEGNTLRHSQIKYDDAEEIQLSNKLKSNFSLIKKSPISIHDVDVGIVPIFIVGMPRSGTSLVEQILSSHDKIEGCGELSYVSEFGAAISEGQIKATKRSLLDFRYKYLEKINKISSKSSMIIDKMPFNFKYLGIITSAFPEAKIIHVKRSPEATCWGIYKICFAKDSNALNFAYDLHSIKNYFLRYADLMKFYSQHLGEKIYDLDYDVLVNKQEIVTKNLIQYLNVKWDNKFLFPEKNHSSARTASLLQVRHKVYKGSSAKWKKYKPFLNGVFDDLEKYN